MQRRRRLAWLRSRRTARLLLLLGTTTPPPFGAAAVNIKVVNNCQVAATVTLDVALTLGAFSDSSSRKRKLEPWGVFVDDEECVPTTLVKAALDLDFDGEVDCTAHTYPIACAFEDELPPVLQLDCAASDSEAASAVCSLTDTHAMCAHVDWSHDESTYCPPRASVVKKVPTMDSSSCPHPELIEDDVLIEHFRCPLCECDSGTTCYGDDCGVCGGAVTRSSSAHATCKPDDWTLGPTSAPSTAPNAEPPAGGSSGGGAPPKATPKPTPAPTDGPTPAPVVDGTSRKQARRASNLAAFVIALFAAGVAACAIRQAVVKQRRHPRSGLYVDIPSIPDGHGISRHRRPPPGRDSSAIEMIDSL